MDKFITNPFDRSSLTNPKLLAGRNSELRQIRFVLRNSSNQVNRIKSMMISGARGVGKTSFLNIIETECSTNNIIPIRLNLTKSNSRNSNEFFWYLFSQTLNSIFDLGLLGGKGGIIQNAIQKIIISNGLNEEMNWIFKTPILHKNYLKNKNSTFEFDLLIEDLKLLRKEIENSDIKDFNQKTKFLFLIDESQNIYSNTKIIQEIRFIIQNQELGYGFVFAGDTSFQKSEWDDVFGGTHREFEIVNLDYFDDVDSVKEYFRKSLESIDWTDQDIESDLFYRFHHACSQIHALTSGKPAWINEIGQKMFERCMTGESKILRFDRNAQNDVKQILLHSGQMDKTKLDFVDSQSPKNQKWLAKIFSSELSTLRQVYFFSKFILTDEFYLSLDEYKLFCEKLIRSEIIILRTDSEKEKSIGYNSEEKNDDFLDIPYIIFGSNSDSIKLWLQINSDGKFLFRYAVPDWNFVHYINSELRSELGNIFILGRASDRLDVDDVRLSTIIESINKNTFDICETPFNFLRIIYKVISRLDNSKKRQILFIQLKNHVSHKIKAWNIYNLDEHDRFIDFTESAIRVKKLKDKVERYNTPEHNFSLDITVDKVAEPLLEQFQNLIIQSGDSRKSGLVIEDKMESLVKYYIKENNVDSSYKVACFIYDRFLEGHDLKLNFLNNTSFVFLIKGETEKSNELLKEAVKIISNEPQGIEDYGTVALIYYNRAIISFKESHFNKALSEFQHVIDYCNDHENIDDSAGALLVIDQIEDDLVLKEIKQGEPEDRMKISIKIESSENISVLNAHI